MLQYLKEILSNCIGDDCYRVVSCTSLNMHSKKSCLKFEVIFRSRIAALLCSMIDGFFLRLNLSNYILPSNPTEKDLKDIPPVTNCDVILYASWFVSDTEELPSDDCVIVHVNKAMLQDSGGVLTSFRIRMILEKMFGRIKTWNWRNAHLKWCNGTISFVSSTSATKAIKYGNLKVTKQYSIPLCPYQKKHTQHIPLSVAVGPDIPIGTTSGGSEHSHHHSGHSSSHQHSSHRSTSSRHIGYGLPHPELTHEPPKIPLASTEEKIDTFHPILISHTPDFHSTSTQPDPDKPIGNIDSGSSIFSCSVTGSDSPQGAQIPHSESSTSLASSDHHGSFIFPSTSIYIPKQDDMTLCPVCKSPSCAHLLHPIWAMRQDMAAIEERVFGILGSVYPICQQVEKELSSKTVSKEKRWKK
ncbi:hypothetical protein ADUPG1_012390 [Aduncisulcus paluster]|uniref:Uncharacterized protein n=1 Tax=Aduncisulcus paluster TaxID=2918883 RepID=A0ABQ5JZA8_9EUKA|nr:hypothetical protein ADUPG1_012390 [Aduncisulcus paluster]